MSAVFLSLFTIFVLSGSSNNDVFKITTDSQAWFLLVFSILFVAVVSTMMWFFRKDIFAIRDDDGKIDFFLLFIAASMIFLFLGTLTISVLFAIPSIQYIFH